jgi:hypothetical protein
MRGWRKCSRPATPLRVDAVSRARAPDAVERATCLTCRAAAEALFDLGARALRVTTFQLAERGQPLPRLDCRSVRRQRKSHERHGHEPSGRPHRRRASGNCHPSAPVDCRQGRSNGAEGRRHARLALSNRPLGAALLGTRGCMVHHGTLRRDGGAV